MKKEYYGNYLGMVINSSDPEYRGRVQVFVPHIMPALYDGWNKEGKDIKISCVGSNIPKGLTPKIHARLVKILPWAESASPIIGASAPGNLFSDITSLAKNAAGAVAGAAQAVANQFIQTPTANPVTVEGGDAQGLINKAKGIAQLDYDPNVTADSSHKGNSQWGMCARGTTGLDKAAGLIDNNGPSAGFNAASDLAAGGSLFGKSSANGYVNPYTSGTGAKYFKPAFVTDPSTYKPQVGDSVFAGGGGGAGNGHAQKCVGFDKNGGAIWVSDNPQSHFFTKNSTADYNNFTVYRLNDEGLARYTAAIGGKVAGQEPIASKSNEASANSGPAGPNPLVNAEGKMPDTAPVPQSNISVGNEMSGTVSGGGTISDKLTQDRQNYFSKELESNPDLANRLSYLANREVGPNAKAQTAWMETVANRAMFGGKSLTETVNNKAYFTADPGRSTPSEANKTAIINVFQKGSNLTNFATENASNDKNAPHFANDRINAGVSGAWYKNGEPVTDPAHIQRLMANQDHDAELLYTANGKNGYSTKAGLAAAKYAKDNGMELSPNPYDPSQISPIASDISSTSVVGNTDGNGRTPIVNTNDMANGMFAYPNPGAMVWVFFREGNPLYPVYFAASYSAAEWKSAYRTGSPGELMSHEDPNIRVTTTVDKKNSAGVIISKSRTNLMNALDNESVFTLAHQHGSNITFKDGCDFHYSRNNKRDEVESDRFIITRGYKEQWTEGDESSNVRGNVTIKVGKIDAESIKAAQTLSDFSYELNQMLMSKK